MVIVHHNNRYVHLKSIEHFCLVQSLKTKDVDFVELEANVEMFQQQFPFHMLALFQVDKLALIHELFETMAQVQVDFANIWVQNCQLYVMA